MPVYYPPATTVPASAVTGLTPLQALFGSGAGGIAQSADLIFDDVFNRLTTPIVRANSLETVTVQPIPLQQLNIDGAGGNGFVVLRNDAGFLQYVASVHRFYSPGFVLNQLELSGALVTITADAQLVCENSINLKSTGAALPTPSGTKVNFGFRTILGVRTPVFVGADGIQHTITFV